MKFSHFLSFALIAGSILLTNHSGYAQGSGMFPDVPPNHWAYEAVKSLKDLGILEGYPPEPKRQKVRTFLTAFSQRASETSAFEPLPREHWAYDNLRRLAEYGIVELPQPSCWLQRQSSQTWTRYEFAICVKRGMEQYTAHSAQSPVALSRSNRSLLIELADEFRTELRELSVKHVEDYARILLADLPDAKR